MDVGIDIRRRKIGNFCQRNMDLLSHCLFILKHATNNQIMLHSIEYIISTIKDLAWHISISHNFTKLDGTGLFQANKRKITKAINYCLTRQ